MIVWILTALKSEFMFQTTLLLGVRALDVLNPLMVGYLLELFCKGAPAGATMLMRQASTVGF
jgi:hypothetical protein